MAEATIATLAADLNFDRVHDLVVLLGMAAEHVPEGQRLVVAVQTSDEGLMVELQTNSQNELAGVSELMMRKLADRADFLEFPTLRFFFNKSHAISNQTTVESS